MSRRRKVFLVAGIAALLVILPLAAMFLVPWDDPPPDDSDLLIHREAIADAENGFALFEEAAATSVRLPADKDALARLAAILENEDWDGELVADQILKNQEPIDLWNQGMARPRLQVPEGNFMLSWYADLADIICLHCRVLYEGGHAREALDEAARLAEFGVRMCRAKGEGQYCAYGLSIEWKGLTRLRWDAGATRLPPAQMKAIVERLGHLHDGGQGFQNFVRADYAKTPALLDLMRQGAVGANLYTVGKVERYLLRSGYHFQLNSTRRIIIENYRRVIELAPKPYSETATWFEQLQKPLTARNSAFLDACSLLTPNYLGQQAAFNLTDSLTRTALWWKEEDFHLEALRLAIAIRCFERTSGRLPQSLDELVPEWIDAVPLDDFDGKPIRWSAARRLLWSVGKDLTDDGGEGCEDESLGLTKDLVFHLDPKEWKKVEEGQGSAK